MASSPTSTQHSKASKKELPVPFTPPRQTAPSNPTYSESPPVIWTTGTVKPTRRGEPKRNRITGNVAPLYDNIDQEFCEPMHGDGRKVADLKGRRDDATIRRVSAQVLSSNATGHTKAMQDPNKGTYSTGTSAMYAVDPIERSFLLKRNKKVVSALSEWIGTSPFNIGSGIAIQKLGLLKGLAHYRSAILHDIPLLPYHPHFYIELSRVDNKLGFCDTGAANAYRALALINAGLDITKRTYPDVLGEDVRSCVEFRLNYEGKPMAVEDELEDLRLHAFRELLGNMLGLGAFWEGLLEANEALKLFPGDFDLIDLKNQLKDGFEGKCRNMPTDIDDVEGTEAVVAYTRKGTIYQKTYPWLDMSLYTRSPAFVKEINQNFGGVNCEVRRVIFGEPTPIVKTRARNEDVGPLGVFATKDIREGDIIMVDRGFMSMSDFSSSHLSHCDACHASVREPYMHPSQVIKPRCCRKVVYCSMECYKAAADGYHRIACGKDFDWLYKDSKGRYNKKAATENWRSILFLRIMCIVLSDRCTQRQDGETPTHPLQHPLILRMTAKYASPSKLHPNHCSDWVYSDNVVTPHRILEKLKVDVYTNSDFTPEVIQTIYWRIENNASQTTVNLSSANRPNGTQSGNSIHRRRRDDRQDKHMVCLNPNYIFFNHSCEPNVDWHGSNPNPWVGISWLKGLNGEILQPGCSAVWCIAARNIKKGEELKISYVGNAMGSDGLDRQAKRYMMDKWFDGGCGCNICAQENETGLADDEDSEEDDSGEDDSEEDESEEYGNEEYESDEDASGEDSGEYSEEDSEIGEIIAQLNRLT